MGTTPPCLLCAQDPRRQEDIPLPRLPLQCHNETICQGIYGMGFGFNHVTRSCKFREEGIRARDYITCRPYSLSLRFVLFSWPMLFCV